MTRGKVFHFLMLLTLVAFMGCSKEEDTSNSFRPQFHLNEATDITRTGATLQGEVYEVDMSSAVDFGFMYSESSAVSTNDVATKKVKGVDDGDGVYRALLTGLTPGKVYYFCLYATKGSSVVKSDILKFKTEVSCAPILGLTTELEKGETSFRLASVIQDVGGADNDLQLYGFGYKEEASEGEFKRLPASGFKDKELKTFEVLIEDLKPGTIYEFFPYAINKLNGEGRGDVITLSTSALESATVTTQDISTVDIGATWVNAVGALEDIGHGSLVGCGFLLSENGAEETKVASELSGKTFMKKVTDLKANTNYSVRAYVETLVLGTTKIGYGARQNFTTLVISAPSVSAASYTINDAKTAMTVVAEVINANNGAVASTGFYYSTTNKVPNQEDIHLPGTLTGTTFSAAIEGLVANTTYYIRSFARNESGMGFGTVTTVTPNKVNPPRVNVVGYTMTGTTLTLTSGVYSDNGSEIKERGFCWSMTSQTISEMTKLVASGNNETFKAQLPNIKVDVVYYVCAYAENALGLIGYSDVREMTPLATLVPSVGEVRLNVNSDGSLKLSSQVTDAHLGTTTAYGFYYNTTGNPTEADIHMPATGNDNEFTATIPYESLQPDVTYYILPYAENKKGKGWGGVKAITPLRAPELGYVSTNCKIDIPTPTLILSSNIWNTWGLPTVERGFCWSKTSQPISEMTKLVATGNDATFTAQLVDIQPDATYYFCAYAKNSIGLVGYNEVRSEIPLPIGIPNVGSVTLTLENDGSLTLSSMVTNANFGTTSVRGFYYNTTGNPSDKDMPVAATGGDDSKFVGTIPAGSLTPNVTYYIRAYAQNQKGKGWGSVMSSIPLKLPNIADVSVVSKTGTSIKVSSHIYDEGTSAVTDKGFCYSISDQLPEIGKKECITVSDKTSTDRSIQAEFKNLSYKTTYYIRAYAENKYGVTYSKIATVATKAIPGGEDIEDPSKKD